MHGSSSTTKLTIAPEGPSGLRLIARAKSQFPGVQIQICVDDQPISTWAPPQNEFQDFTLPFIIHGGGPHELELRFTAPHTTSQSPITFTRLQIIPDCPPQ